MRLDRVRWAEWMIGAGGALLLASMLALPWYRSSPARPGSLSGWTSLTHLRWVFVACAAVALATWLAQAGLRAPAVPATLTLFAGFLGGATTILLIYRVLADPPGGARKVGGFVALAAALVVTYGSWRSLRTDGISPRDAPADIPTVDPLAGTHS
jgi:hypothetical protein